jgi:arginine-tRNA-protein transferase
VNRQVLVYDGLQRCPYLEGKVARMPLYRQLRPLGWDEADERFASAERRVGRALYRTACPACSECKGIRVPVRDFRPSRSQRRVLKRWPEDSRIEIGPATVSRAKVKLFNLHRLDRGLAEHSEQPMSPEGYVGWLVRSCFDTIEMRYYLGSRLVGVGILDLGRTAASSVYYYFDPDPDIAQLSPGVYSALQEIEFCRGSNRDYLYLGLFVAGCDKLSYKAQYRPHERLVDGDWRRFEQGLEQPHPQGDSG